MRRWSGALALAAMLGLSQAGCHAPDRAHPPARDGLSGWSTVTFIILPPDRIYLSGERVDLKDVPALLHKHEAGYVDIYEVGPEDGREVCAKLGAVITGTGNYAMAIHRIGGPDEH